MAFLSSIIPSHAIADWLLQNIDKLLDLLGLESHHSVEQVIYFIIILSFSILIGLLIKKLILIVLQKIVKERNTPAGRELLKQRTLIKCAHIITPMVFMALLPFAFESTSSILRIIYRITIAYTLVMLGIGLSAIFKFIYKLYDEKDNTKGLPLKGVLNIAIGIVWAIIIIVVVSVFVDKSPAALLGGLTAFAAVLMLIFKDTILGFVAGLQMSENDMLRVGDWIVVPSTPANGVVEDVSLSTVKVRNFDNTIVTVPPYTLVSTSFQNWRGMSETGIRRIAMSIYINPDTMASCSPELISKVSAKYPAVKDFVAKLQQSGKTVAWEAGNAPVNGSTETNLGLFRAYMASYLIASDMVDHNSDLMVCVQNTSHEGVALQIYCFSVTTQWEQYEGVLSTIMEHAIVAAGDFDLEILSADHLNISKND